MFLYGKLGTFLDYFFFWVISYTVYTWQVFTDFYISYNFESKLWCSYMASLVHHVFNYFYFWVVSYSVCLLLFTQLFLLLSNKLKYLNVASIYSLVYYFLFGLSVSITALSTMTPSITLLSMSCQHNDKSLIKKYY